MIGFLTDMLDSGLWHVGDSTKRVQGFSTLVSSHVTLATFQLTIWILTQQMQEGTQLCSRYWNPAPEC